jgi:hypothetical protein
MSAGRMLGFGLLAAILGTMLGGGLGLAGGLAFTELADTSGFEGYSGYVAAYWMLAGGLLGLVVGGVYGAYLGRS